ncbi:GH92 family glycosyl hydrolase [Curtobacterium sp. 1P10AnD]|uniref:GH92 family glycosyl hydrolase n=1 Tax=Curtobacterium sp. 1P10AnD TaxID=3132283 RepID=UPI0039A26268
MDELQRSGGPTTAVAARNGVGYVSAEAWLVERPSGADPTEGIVPGFVGRTIAPGDELSWVWFPERTLPEGLTEPTEAELPHFWDATAFSIDLVCTDGTRLSDTARDQYGDALTPEAQDAARKQWVDQWNRRAVDLTPLAGRVVDRLEARLGSATPHPAGDGARPALRGWLDDVRLGPARPEPQTPLDHVRTTRGTQASSRFSRGNNAPLVGLPHGGVFGLPMTDASSNRWPYAFHEHSLVDDAGRVRPAIQAFATSHIPSPWMGDRGVFQVMPSPLDTPDPDRTARALGFDHDDEQDGPHRYRVALDHGVTAEVTAGEFALGFRFTGTRSVVLDHHGRVADVTVTVADGTAVVECLLDDRPGTPPHHVHLRVPGVTADHTTVTDDELRGWFAVDGDVDVLLGISTVSAEDARANLDAAGDFDTMRVRAEERWTAELSTMSFEGATPDQLTSLYSGLYRLFLYPNRAGETARDGTPRHRSPYGSVQASPIRDEPGPEVVEGLFTTTNGFWDTYRTAWPLLALLTPETAGELAQGFVEHHHDGGWTPRWSAPGAEDCMTGTTSDTVFADLAAKGIDGFDLAAAYRSAVRNATVPPRDERVGRKGSLPGAFRGHVDTATHEGMSWTLDAAINDWGLAVMADLLARRASTDAERLRAEHEWFARRSLQYRNVFDTERGFFIGRDPDGSWRVGTEFDPRDWGDDYTETNAWGTAFTAPHDGAGIVDLHGGPARFDAALDAFFTTPETGSTERSGSYGFPIHEMTEARDVRTGMLGLSNQPAHHIPFFPMFTGRHDDAHRIVRGALERLFVGSDLGQGYPGDEDNGEMSAWYVFATIGLYPLAPSTGTYVLVPPSVRRTVLRPASSDGSATPTVVEVVSGPVGGYVASVTVDGAPWESVSMPHEIVAAASRIEFTLSSEPTGWASDSRPVSASDVHGFRDTPVDLLRAGSHPLSDDTGRTATALAAGTSVTFEVPPVPVSLYTVTVEAAGTYSWDVSLDGVTASVHGAEFAWAGQTRVFRLEGTGSSFTFSAVTDVALTQLELVAADGQR